MQLQKLPSIWTDSSVTISFPTSSAAMDKSKRFEYNSIYYKDDPCKPKKKIDQFMFPHDLLNNFRKCIKEASKSKSIEKKKHVLRSYYEEDQEKTDGLPPRINNITNKLYQKPASLAGSRDFFGNRCSFQEKELVDMCRYPSFNTSSLRSSSNQKIYITAAKRLDLSRPVNFNPGPGAYLRGNVSSNKKKLNISINGQEAVLKRKGRDKVQRSIELQSKSIEHH